MRFLDLNRNCKYNLQFLELRREGGFSSDYWRRKKISFRNQIIISFRKKYPKHSEEKIKELAKKAIEKFQSFFKLKR